MDELDFYAQEETAPETTDDIELATVAAIGENGVTLLIDGNEESGTKEYRVNAAQLIQAGDRVKISRISGSYVVNFVVGSPMERYPIPSGGEDGQVLTKDGSSPYAVKWATAGSLPSGGSAGQALTKKTSSNYDVEWSTIGVLPSGGSTGQVLRKTSSTDYAIEWATIGTLPSGGTAGQVLAKTNATNYNVEWVTPSVSLLKSGNYTVTLNSSSLIPNSAGSVSLGTTTYPFGNLYTNGYVQLGANTYNARLGFFGTTPISKISTITTSSTLANLIQALKNYGLF